MKNTEKKAKKGVKLEYLAAGIGISILTALITGLPLFLTLQNKGDELAKAKKLSIYTHGVLTEIAINVSYDGVYKFNTLILADFKAELKKQITRIILHDKIDSLTAWNIKAKATDIGLTGTITLDTTAIKQLSIDTHGDLTEIAINVSYDGVYKFNTLTLADFKWELMKQIKGKNYEIDSLTAENIKAKATDIGLTGTITLDTTAIKQLSINTHGDLTEIAINVSYDGVYMFNTFYDGVYKFNTLTLADFKAELKKQIKGKNDEIDSLTAGNIEAKATDIGLTGTITLDTTAIKKLSIDTHGDLTEIAINVSYDGVYKFNTLTLADFKAELKKQITGKNDEIDSLTAGNIEAKATDIGLTGTITLDTTAIKQLSINTHGDLTEIAINVSYDGVYKFNTLTLADFKAELKKQITGKNYEIDSLTAGNIKAKATDIGLTGTITVVDITAIKQLSINTHGDLTEIAINVSYDGVYKFNTLTLADFKAELKKQITGIILHDKIDSLTAGNIKAKAKVIDLTGTITLDTTAIKQLSINTHGDLTEIAINVSYDGVYMFNTFYGGVYKFNTLTLADFKAELKKQIKGKNDEIDSLTAGNIEAKATDIGLTGTITLDTTAIKKLSIDTHGDLTEIAINVSYDGVYKFNTLTLADFKAELKKQITGIILHYKIDSLTAGNIKAKATDIGLTGTITLDTTAIKQLSIDTHGDLTEIAINVSYDGVYKFNTLTLADFKAELKKQIKGKNDEIDSLTAWNIKAKATDIGLTGTITLDTTAIKQLSIDTHGDLTEIAINVSYDDGVYMYNTFSGGVYKFNTLTLADFKAELKKQIKGKNDEIDSLTAGNIEAKATDIGLTGTITLDTPTVINSPWYLNEPKTQKDNQKWKAESSIKLLSIEHTAQTDLLIPFGFSFLIIFLSFGALLKKLKRLIKKRK